MRGLLPYMLTLLSLPVWSAQSVIYPPHESKDDTRFNDLIEILQVALSKTEDDFGPFQLSASAMPMREARYIEELKNGGKINLIWTSTSVEKEQALLPIRIPLRKGLLGYRVSLIHRDRQADIDRLQNLEDLRQFSIGQGSGWGDVAIYEANGITVATAGYESLFKMLQAKRFDLFPRGIGEAFTEFDARKGTLTGLKVEENLLIYYPWPYYFFTNKDNAKLAERLETGLRRMIADGSFEAIFQKYNGAALERAKVKNRRIIRIDNHQLPPQTPLDDASLWYDPLAP